MLRKVKNRKGFTLIELMIVVAIIGILAAIAIPAYLDYTKKAKLSEIVHQFDAIATAASEYHSDYGKFPETLSVTDIAKVHSKFVSSWTVGNTDANTKYNVTANITGITDFTNNKLTMILRYDSSTGYDKNWTGISTASKRRLVGRDFEWE